MTLTLVDICDLFEWAHSITGQTSPNKELTSNWTPGVGEGRTPKGRLLQIYILSQVEHLQNVTRF